MSFAVTSTVDILYLRYYLFFVGVFVAFTSFLMVSYSLLFGIMLVLLFLWLLLELSRIELQIVAVYMVSLVHVSN